MSFATPSWFREIRGHATAARQAVLARARLRHHGASDVQELERVRLQHAERGGRAREPRRADRGRPRPGPVPLARPSGGKLPLPQRVLRDDRNAGVAPALRRHSRGTGSEHRDGGSLRDDGSTGDALRPYGMQTEVTPRIGNATAGSVSSCGTKDASIRGGLAQVSSTVIAMRLVNPRGEVEVASEDSGF